MNELFEYARIRTEARSWPRVLEGVRERARPAIEAAGGSLYGVFLPQIGLPAHEGVVLSVWPDRDSQAPGALAALRELDGVVSCERERLVATVRPESAEPLPAGGVYAHRSFELLESDWPEFLTLSEEAWPVFEKDFEARVIGLFRSLDVEPPLAKALLLTRYGSLADWQQSRMAGQRSDAQERTRARFGRRHELTRSTIVVTTQLAPS